jgi:hypothetical protein
MQTPANIAIETVSQINHRDDAVRRDETMWFLLWISVWVVALAALLPALI